MNSITAFLRKFIHKKLEKQKQHYEQRAYNNLSKLYSVIRPGDVVLVEGRSEMSRLIKLFSNSHWSHVAMYVGKTLCPRIFNKSKVLTFQGKANILFFNFLS